MSLPVGVIFSFHTLQLIVAVSYLQSTNHHSILRSADCMFKVSQGHSKVNTGNVDNY